MKKNKPIKQKELKKKLEEKLEEKLAITNESDKLPRTAYRFQIRCTICLSSQMVSLIIALTIYPLWFVTIFLFYILLL